jgi:hypothetical protein
MDDNTILSDVLMYAAITLGVAFAILNVIGDRMVKRRMKPQPIREVYSWAVICVIFCLIFTILYFIAQSKILSHFK